MISPVPLRKPTPPLKNPDIRIPSASSNDTNFNPFNWAADEVVNYCKNNLQVRTNYLFGLPFDFAVS